jgi:hypothetical protein
MKHRGQGAALAVNDDGLAFKPQVKQFELKVVLAGEKRSAKKGLSGIRHHGRCR